MPHYTDKPIGKFPLSHGLGPGLLQMGQMDMAGMEFLLSTFLMQAVRNPGVMQYRYHEEACNGYEYEETAIFYPGRNTIWTNSTLCPRMHNHHVGETCWMCGMVG